MIIVQIIGGLGNQMFQYALGRCLSLKLQKEFKMDLTGFNNYKLHHYALGHLNILENIASLEEVKRYTFKVLFSRVTRIIKKGTKPYFKRSIVQEQSTNFDPNIFKILGNVYLKGYWQSEKYFKPIEAIIRREFTIKDQPDETNKKIALNIAHSNAVSIHVRRADYINNQTTNKVHGVCSLDYYHKAVEVVAKKIKSPIFFIFSDDHEWVKNNLKFNYPMVYVTHNLVEKNYEDLRLMSLCQHNIIANSSFSWWGTWLNPNKKKIVIAPKLWFQDKSRDASDLIPSTWIKI